MSESEFIVASHPQKVRFVRTTHNFKNVVIDTQNPSVCCRFPNEEYAALGARMMNLDPQSAPAYHWDKISSI